MPLIDLSMSIQPHWRWQIGTSRALAHEKGDPFQATVLTVPLHAFTHVDTPLHIEPGRVTVDRVAVLLAAPGALAAHRRLPGRGHVGGPGHPGGGAVPGRARR